MTPYHVRSRSKIFQKRVAGTLWLQNPPECRKLRTGFKFKTVTLDRNTANVIN